MTLPKGDGPHILIYDIETTPINGWAWSSRDIDRLLRVDQDSRILSVAWTWLGEKNVNSLHANGGDDLVIADVLWSLFDHADIVIAHNGDRYDQPRTNTRFLVHGYGPPSPYQTIDTLKVARYKFGHHNNSLDSLAKLIGTAEKKAHSGMSLWFRCMDGDKKAMKEMIQYNKQDVVALKELYLELRPWIDNHPNIAQWKKGQYACTNCMSTDLQKRGVKRTRVSEFQQYQCNNCGKYSRERRSIHQGVVNRTMLT